MSVNTPWDIARKRKVYRVPPYPSVLYPPELLDRGVNFFVLALEQLGAVTEWSCDGHGNPRQFYIVFLAPYELALKIKSAGFFSVQIEGRGRWSLRIGWTGDAKELLKTLRWASEEWVKRLGLDW